MDIKAVQSELNKRGYGPLNVDGQLGPKTNTAIKNFQKDSGIKVDGLAGPDTLALLLPATEPSSKVLNIRAMEIAESQIGVREATGKNDGPQVEAYLKSVGLGKGFSWCAAFLYWCFQKAATDLKTANPLVKTGGVLAHYNQSKATKVTKPQPGDIFIMDFGGGAGHTGIVKAVRGTAVDTIEGNTNDQGSREGQGVYQRTRSISSIKGFLRY